MFFAIRKFTFWGENTISLFSTLCAELRLICSVSLRYWGERMKKKITAIISGIFLSFAKKLSKNDFQDFLQLQKWPMGTPAAADAAVGVPRQPQDGKRKLSFLDRF